MRLTLADPPEQGWIASRRYYGGALDSAFRAKRYAVRRAAPRGAPLPCQADYLRRLSP